MALKRAKKEQNEEVEDLGSLKRPAARKVAENDPTLKKMKEIQKKKPVDTRDFDPEEVGFPFTECGAFQEVGGENLDIELKKNPHLAQNKVGFFKVPLDFIPMTLEDGMKRKKYTWVSKGNRSTSHWNARKLCLLDIEFLTRYAEPGMLVVYAGAAPALHLEKLSKMFPSVSFLLVDRGGFRCPAIKDVIEIWEMESPFENSKVLSDIRKRKERKLFISSMQTGEVGSGEEYVRRDMEAQQNWHNTLEPEMSLLKFRLPWEDGKTTYLDGKILFTCHGPQTTTETRLLVANGAGVKEYDNRAYEEQMFYFNRMTRVQYYDHELALDNYTYKVEEEEQTKNEHEGEGDQPKEGGEKNDVKKEEVKKDDPLKKAFMSEEERKAAFRKEREKFFLDHCYDCSREFKILKDYLTKYEFWRREDVAEEEEDVELQKEMEAKALLDQIAREHVEISKNLHYARQSVHVQEGVPDDEAEEMEDEKEEEDEEINYDF